MALVYCTKCRHRVSTTAPRCPGCGGPGPAARSQVSVGSSAQVSWPGARDKIAHDPAVGLASSGTAQSRANAPQGTNSLGESGVVTVLATLGMVFGVLGMLAGLVPFFGELGLALCLPAGIASAAAVAIGYLQHAKRALAVGALTISLIGVFLSEGNIAHFPQQASSNESGGASEQPGAATTVAIESAPAKTGTDPADVTPDLYAREYWDAKLTKCGDSYFAKWTASAPVFGGKTCPTVFAEFRDMTVSIESSDVSEADHLNGMDWAGKAHMKAKAFRTRVGRDSWSEWKASSNVWLEPLGVTGYNFDLDLRKVNGRWDTTGCGGACDRVWPPPVIQDFPLNMCAYTPSKPNCNEWNQPAP